MLQMAEKQSRSLYTSCVVVVVLGIVVDGVDQSTTLPATHYTIYHILPHCRLPHCSVLV